MDELNVNIVGVTMPAFFRSLIVALIYCSLSRDRAVLLVYHFPR